MQWSKEVRVYEDSALIQNISVNNSEVRDRKDLKFTPKEEALVYLALS